MPSGAAAPSARLTRSGLPAFGWRTIGGGETIPWLSHMVIGIQDARTATYEASGPAPSRKVGAACSRLRARQSRASPGLNPGREPVGPGLPLPCQQPEPSRRLLRWVCRDKMEFPDLSTDRPEWHPPVESAWRREHDKGPPGNLFWPGVRGPA